jgi:hypothetical protein
MSDQAYETWEKSELISPLTAFRKQMIALDTHLRAVVESGDIQSLVDALVLLHKIKAEIGLIYSDYSTQIIDRLPDIPTSSSNGQAVEKKTGADRKAWNHEELTREVLRRLSQMSVDLDTGEVVMTSEQIALKLLDFVQPSYWRVKELSKIGINADQYCEVGEAKTNIIVHKEQIR